MLAGTVGRTTAQFLGTGGVTWHWLPPFTWRVTVLPREGKAGNGAREGLALEIHGDKGLRWLKSVSLNKFCGSDTSRLFWKVPVPSTIPGTFLGCLLSLLFIHNPRFQTQCFTGKSQNPPSTGEQGQMLQGLLLPAPQTAILFLLHQQLPVCAEVCSGGSCPSGRETKRKVAELNWASRAFQDAEDPAGLFSLVTVWHVRRTDCLSSPQVLPVAP